MQGIVKSFGANRVLHEVSFEVPRGEVHALLGENGAGKSTLMKILMGVHSADAGRIVFDGEDVTALSLRDRLSRGIAMIFQELSVLPNRSVAENLFVLREPRSWGKRVDDRRMIAEARQLIDQFGFALDPTRLVDRLGFAQRQMVEILKAISRGAKLLVMDEPTSSLTMREEDTLFATIDQLKARGIGIVYISHRMADVLRLSDHISIIKDGRLVGPLDPASTSIEAIAELMSKPKGGGAATEITARPTAVAPRPSIGAAGPILDVRDLSTARKLDRVSFSVAAGEIIGVGGLVGSGRTTLAKALFGLIPDATGEVLLAGNPLPLHDPAAAARLGVALVPEDRRREGLVGGRSLGENLVLPSLPNFVSGGPFGRVSKGRIGALFDRYRNELGILCRGGDQEARELSGGNQQKIVFAKWLATGPKLLLLDEPTSGVDINAKRDMRALIRRAAEQGLGVLLISSELEELIELSDRIIIIAAGRLTRIVDRVHDETTLRALLQSDAARQERTPSREEAAA
jgi:ribose transport system ATP-binding protein